MKKLSRAEKIRRYITRNPNTPVREIADAFKTSYQIVYLIKRDMLDKQTLDTAKVLGTTMAKADIPKLTDEQLTRLVKNKEKPRTRMARSGWKTLGIFSSEKPLPVTMEEPKADPVNHPAHYKVGGMETIDFIEAKQLGYNLGNVVKYVTRAAHKGNASEDLAKARWYLNREISKLTEANS